MQIVPQATIKEIAQAIALGKTCYLQRNTTNITTIDPTIEDAALITKQEQTVAKLEEDIERYIKVEKLNTATQLRIMKNFLEELPDKSVRKELSNALNRKNPVRNFSRAVGSDMELNQHWSNFKVKEYQRWVSNFLIDSYNYKGTL